LTKYYDGHLIKTNCKLQNDICEYSQNETSQKRHATY